MVELTAPQPRDVICDPACGTAGYLTIAGEYLREHNPEYCNAHARAREAQAEALVEMAWQISKRRQK